MAPIPQKVRDARIRGDTTALSAMGRAGGKAAGAKRRRSSQIAELLADDRRFRFEADEKFRREQANEHIIPFDAYD